MKTLTLLLLTLLLLVNGSASKSIINTLPGFAGDLPFVLETGYVEVGSKEEGQLFYQFIESERSPENDPLVLWLAGGPGCSGLTGLFYEIGPLAFNYAKCRSENKPVLELNPYSWTKVANIIFLDAPIGSGFSYSTTAEGYMVSDTITAAQNCEFLRKWLMDHPKFLDNPLYVGGDSYSGRVVPVVVQIISDGNRAGNKPTVNLMGYVIGNPSTDPKIDMNSRVPFAHGNALISDEIYRSFKKNCKGEYLNPNKNNVPCMKAIDNINECIGRLYKAHILEPNCKTLSSPKPAAEDLDFTIFSDDYANLLLPSSHANEPWCRDHHYTYSNIWANDISVREALHVRKDTKEQWLRCNRSVSYTHDVGSAVDYHRNLSKTTAYRALVYSGDKDLYFPYLGTLAWIKSLNLTIKSDWHPWFVDGQVAGYCTEYTNNNFALVYATVKGAGHAVPEFKPIENGGSMVFDLPSLIISKTTQSFNIENYNSNYNSFFKIYFKFSIYFSSRKVSLSKKIR